MRTFNTLSSDFVSKNGGLILKFLGDAGLCIFPEQVASQAIVAMISFKAQMDKWLQSNMPGADLAVNCHMGPVTVGPTPGFNGQDQIDVFGETVNLCFTISKQGFVISSEAFESLSTDERKQFKKSAPPVVYRLITK